MWSVFGSVVHTRARSRRRAVFPSLLCAHCTDPHLSRAWARCAYVLLVLVLRHRNSALSLALIIVCKVKCADYTELSLRVRRTSATLMGGGWGVKERFSFSEGDVIVTERAVWRVADENYQRWKTHPRVSGTIPNKAIDKLTSRN